MTVRARVSAGLILVLVTASLGASSASAAVVRPASGTVTLMGISCAGSPICVAVGSGPIPPGTPPGPAVTAPVVVPVTGGTPGAATVAVALPSTVGALSGVACPIAGNCIAAGSASFLFGTVVTIHNRLPTGATPVPQSMEVTGVACLTATTCLGVGSDSLGAPPEAALLPITNGTPGTVQFAALGSLDGAACPTSTTCVAVGRQIILQPTPPPLGEIVPYTNGVPGVAVPVPGSDELTAITCTGPAACLAVGRTTVAGTSVAVLVPVANGVPGAAITVPGISTLNGIACLTAGRCLAVGTATVGSASIGMRVRIAFGRPGRVTAVPGTTALRGVSCGAVSRCFAVGDQTAAGASHGVAVTFRLPRG